MRPIKLSLENFGPYREKTEVDFSRLGRFFLVSGKTGSGKSSLFDAMTYALYGKAPGARSGKESSLVSDFAQPGDKPTVVFEFSLSGVRYRAARVAPHTRPKRGGGLRNVPSEAALQVGVRGPEGEDEWKPLTSGVDLTNRKVESLIGLTADEFSRIILLPQGQFQEFLEMTSTQRSAVLEKLFPVEIHGLVADAAQERAKAAQADAEALRREFGRLSEEAGQDPEERLGRLSLELEEREGKIRSLVDAIAGLEADRGRKMDQLARAERARAAARKALELEARADEEAARARRVSGARAALSAAPALEALEIAQTAAEKGAARALALENRLRAMEARRSGIDLDRHILSETERKIEDAAREIGKLEAAMPAWDRRRKAAAELEAARNLVSSLESGFAAEEKKAADLVGRLSQTKPSLGEENAARSRAEKARNLLLGIGELRALCLEWAESLKRLGKTEAALGERAARAAGLREKLDSASVRLEEEEGLCERSRAAMLAAGLAPGMPCPVCGSTEHPRPASFEGEFPSEDALKKSRAAVRDLSNRLADEEGQLGRDRSDIEELSASAAASGEKVVRRSETLLADPAYPLMKEETAAPAGIFIPECGSQADQALSAAVQVFSAASGWAESLEASLAAIERRKLAAESIEKELSSRKAGLDAGRSRLEAARNSAGAALAGFEEAERASGSTDPAPVKNALAAERDTLIVEKTGLERRIHEWDAGIAECAAAHRAMETEIDSLFGVLLNRLESGIGALRDNGFMGSDPGSAEFADIVPNVSAGFIIDPWGWLEKLEAGARVCADNDEGADDDAGAAAGGGAGNVQGSLEADAVPFSWSLRRKASGLSAGIQSLPYNRKETTEAIGRVFRMRLSPADCRKEESLLERLRNDRATARAEAEALSADLLPEGSDDNGIALLDERLSAARGELSGARKEEGEKRIEKARLAETIARQERSLGELKELSGKSAALQGLAALLRGDASPQKLPFKHYVLAMYFGIVVNRASIHLSNMSDGRYYLQIDREKSSGNGRAGLDLEVLDTWTGAFRSTWTLSGGERFLCSISLALGLADSIRERRGGVSLDSIFIDEGFGSLDEESLDRAMAVLDRIRGGRTIGVVSHVQELKSRIPCRIEVEKTPSGSRLASVTLSEWPAAPQ